MPIALLLPPLLQPLTDHMPCSSHCGIRHLLVHCPVATNLPIGCCEITLVLFHIISHEVCSPFQASNGLSTVSPRSFLASHSSVPAYRACAIHFSYITTRRSTNTLTLIYHSLVCSTTHQYGVPLHPHLHCKPVYVFYFPQRTSGRVE